MDNSDKMTQSRQVRWQTNIEKLLAETLFSSIHKHGSIENGWFRLSYKTKLVRITPENDWQSIHNICTEMLKKNQNTIIY